MHPTHYCTQCGALWRQCDDGSWNLRSETAGPCCDNAAMGEQIKPLATPSAQAEPQVPLPEFLTAQDKADLLRIEDCFSDGEGYDLPLERMARLAELGVISHNGGGVYSITAFGMYCTGAWPVLPLKTAAESNAEAGQLHAERMAHGIGKQEGT